jgi:hypothetical protein
LKALETLKAEYLKSIIATNPGGLAQKFISNDPLPAETGSPLFQGEN